MPYLKLLSNEELLHSEQLISGASQLVAEILGKPEKFVMVSLHEKQQMLFSGNDEPMFFCELKSIGLPADRTKEISKKLTEFLMKETGVARERIYIEFADAERHMWGWNGSTFEK